VNRSGLDIIEYRQEGYKPLIDFNGWRVAYLRYLDELHPQNITYLERHMQTDEVFVLMEGEVTLMMGEGDQTVTAVYGVPMEPLKLYNVKQGTWHGVLMSKDATILLVENQNTGNANSEYFNLTPEIREVFNAEAKKIKDWA
jgi:ureidoglycolate hydrolase